MTVPVTSRPSQQVPSNIIENEDLAWERFQKAIIDEDINICYDMSLKDFEHSGVHDLFKVNDCLCLVFAIFFSFHRDRIHRVRLFADRDFRSLVTLRRLAKWRLGPRPSNKALAHEITVRRSKFLLDVILNT